MNEIEQVFEKLPPLIDLSDRVLQGIQTAVEGEDQETERMLTLFTSLVEAFACYEAYVDHLPTALRLVDELTQSHATQHHLAVVLDWTRDA